MRYHGVQAGFGSPRRSSPAVGAVTEVVVEPLDRRRAEELADDLLAMSSDSTWDDWTRENLLSDREGKWELSLASDGTVPVGWAIASRTELGVHLHHVVVASGHRSRGVGAALVRRLLDTAAPGVLTLKVHPENPRAAAFYERLGLVEGEPSPSGYRMFASAPQEEPSR